MDQLQLKLTIVLSLILYWTQWYFPYTMSGWVVFLWIYDKALKKMYLKWLLTQLRNYRPSLVLKQNINGLTAYEVGTIPSEQELHLEQPKLFSISDREEGQSETLNFTTCDDEGSILNIRLTLFGRKKATVMLLWTNTVTNETYSPPHSPDTTYHVDRGNNLTYRAGGLSLIVLEPMRRWRVLFNGMLKSHSTGKVVHVRMNLIWTTLHCPFDWSKDVAIEPMVKALSPLEIYSNEKLEMLSNEMNTKSYDQWGNLFGTVVVENSEQLINLKGDASEHGKAQ